MQAMKYRFLLTMTVLQLLQVRATAQPLQLWYRQPAAKWTEALPLGNGRIGAMVFGDAQHEHLQLNEATLWTGEPRAYERAGAVQYLPQIRQLLFEGKQAEAEALAEQHFMGRKNNEDNYAALQYRWLQQVRADTADAWAATRNGWQQMQLPATAGWEAAGLEGVDGAVWFSTNITLPAAWKGKNLVLELGRVRDMDYTYVNGHLAGATNGMEYNRRYLVPAAAWKQGSNRIALQVINWNDKGGLTGSKGNAPFWRLYPEGDSSKPLSLPAVWQYRVQNSEPPAFPHYQADYQPLGDLWIHMQGSGPVENYRRALNIDSAVSTVQYTQNGISFTRECWVSAAENMLAIHIKSNQPAAISLQASLGSVHRRHHLRRINAHTLAMEVQVHNGVLKGNAWLYATAKDGSVVVTDTAIQVSHASELTLYLVAATNFKNYRDVSGNPALLCSNTLGRLHSRGYQQLKAAHISRYRSLYHTFSIDLGHGAGEQLPTDQRILQYASTFDPSLIALYVQYARYLLIAASPPGGHAANLQGIWNDLLTPPWGSKFTTNINLEMNYWPAEVLHLSPCTQPLFNLVDEVAASGHATAKAHYGAPGWVLHHNTDIWRGTAPINAANHGIWVTGGAWLCHHLWEHYLFTQDTVFLRSRAYPLMKEAAAFFAHFLVKDPRNGWLISTPSNSPEHGGLVAGPTMDHQLIRDLLKNCMAAATVLGTDAPAIQNWKALYSRIAPNQVGKYGQLQEWLEDKDVPTDDHRHVSHLWGVYPGTDITWDSAALMKAAQQSLLYRGDGGTGWSLAWKVNLWARLRNGDHALLMMNKLLHAAEAGGRKGSGVYPNLFDAHPPFQIDGNFGGAAGVAEMLLQSQGDAIELLPALPSALSSGAVKGICARGGFVLDIQWNNHRLQQVRVRSLAGKKCRLQYGERTIDFATLKNGIYVFNGKLEKQER